LRISSDPSCIPARAVEHASALNPAGTGHNRDQVDQVDKADKVGSHRFLRSIGKLIVHPG
jgi:hypothetical protein